MFYNFFSHIFTPIIFFSFTILNQLISTNNKFYNTKLFNFLNNYIIIHLDYISYPLSIQIFDHINTLIHNKKYPKNKYSIFPIYIFKYQLPTTKYKIYNNSNQ